MSLLPKVSFLDPLISSTSRHSRMRGIQCQTCQRYSPLNWWALLKRVVCYSKTKRCSGDHSMRCCLKWITCVLSKSDHFQRGFQHPRKKEKWNTPLGPQWFQCHFQNRADGSHQGQYEVNPYQFGTFTTTSTAWAFLHDYVPRFNMVWNVGRDGPHHVIKVMFFFFFSKWSSLVEYSGDCTQCLPKPWEMHLLLRALREVWWATEDTKPLCNVRNTQWLRGVGRGISKKWAYG